MTQPKRGLGRGLGALFTNTAVEAPPPPATPTPEPAPVAAPAAPPEPSPNPASGAPPATVAAAPEPPPPVAAVPPAPEPVTQAAAAPAPAAAAPAPAPVEATGSEPTAPADHAAPPPRSEPPPSPAAAPASTNGFAAARRGGPEYLDIDLIAPNPEQPRTHFEPGQLHELADSIREHGIIQPLIVSRDEHGGYRLIAGERRLQAARLAGLDHVPVVIREAADAELLELALIENIQRADLNAIEEAMAYRRLMDEYGLTQEEVARRVGKNRATVANAMRLLQLEQEIRRSLVAGEITEGHARALLGLPDSRARLNAWREVVKRRMSVRDTESLVRRALATTPQTASTPGATTARRDAAYADIEARLRRALSTRVTVAPQKRGARIVIECYSTEEFENVVAMLAGDDDD